MPIYLAFLSFTAYKGTILLTSAVLLYCYVVLINDDDEDDELFIEAV